MVVASGTDSANVEIEIIDSSKNVLDACYTSTQCKMSAPASETYTVNLKGLSDFQDANLSAAWMGPQVSSLEVGTSKSISLPKHAHKLEAVSVVGTIPVLQESETVTQNTPLIRAFHSDNKIGYAYDDDYDPYKQAERSCYLTWIYNGLNGSSYEVAVCFNEEWCNYFHTSLSCYHYGDEPDSDPEPIPPKRTPIDDGSTSCEECVIFTPPESTEISVIDTSERIYTCTLCEQLQLALNTFILDISSEDSEVDDTIKLDITSIGLEGVWEISDIHGSDSLINNLLSVFDGLILNASTTSSERYETQSFTVSQTTCEAANSIGTWEFVYDEANKTYTLIDSSPGGILERTQGDCTYFPSENGRLTLPGTTERNVAADYLTNLLTQQSESNYFSVDFTAANKFKINMDMPGLEGTWVIMSKLCQFLGWNAKVTKEFSDKVIELSKRLGVDPNVLMAIMAFESGRTFSPTAGSSAVGLIQFTKAGAKYVGVTKDQLKGMTAIEQLDYVEKFLDNPRYKNSDGTTKLSSINDFYMAIHWPAAVGKPDSYVLYSKDDSEDGITPDYYTPNKGLDINGNNDGKVTKDEAAAQAHKLYEEGKKYEICQ